MRKSYFDNLWFACQQWTKREIFAQVPTKITLSPACKTDFVMSIAMVSLGHPGGPESSRIWPWTIPPFNSLSRGGQRVVNLRIELAIVAALWVKGTPLCGIEDPCVCFNIASASMSDIFKSIALVWREKPRQSSCLTSSNWSRSSRDDILNCLVAISI